MIRSATTQTQIQGFEVAHPNIYPTCELLELVKGPVLQNQSCGVSLTQGNSRISEKSSGEDPVWMV